MAIAMSLLVYATTLALVPCLCAMLMSSLVFNGVCNCVVTSCIVLLVFVCSLAVSLASLIWKLND